ncbi:hypothetical protein [Dongia sp.]|uniref:hypothetical protein n=1 Tax=Dongia sp. TaxID=1977262 RepID=UPI0035B3DE67
MARKLAAKCRMYVRELLEKEWDPIGVHNSDWPGDEYGEYAIEAFGVILRHGSVEDVVDCLWQAETGAMGLNGDRGKTEMIARKLYDGVVAIMKAESTAPNDQTP